MRELIERYTLSELLPHDHPMILIDRLIDASEEHIQSCVVISPGAPFVRADGVPGYVVLEYMAQTIAAHAGLLAKKEGVPIKIGLLLGTRKTQIFCPWIDIGEVVEVEAVVAYNDGTMAQFDCKARTSESAIAEGRLNVYQPEDLDIFKASIKV